MKERGTYVIMTGVLIRGQRHTENSDDGSRDWGDVPRIAKECQGLPATPEAKRKA